MAYNNDEKHEKALRNKSSCLKCGVTVIPADNGKLYEFVGATSNTLMLTEDGYKYVKGPRPSVHYCDPGDLEAAKKLRWQRLIDKKAVIPVDKLWDNYRWAWDNGYNVGWNRELGKILVKEGVVLP